jgi:hypothetical protein
MHCTHVIINFQGVNAFNISVACAIRPSVNPLQNMFCNVCIDRYLEQPNMKGNHA